MRKGRAAVGDLRAQRIPGSPGAGVDTKIEGGMIISTDKQTGQIVSATTECRPEHCPRYCSKRRQHGAPCISPVPAKSALLRPSRTSKGCKPRSTLRIAKQQGEQIDVAQQAQQQQVKLLEARQAMQGLPTGSGGDARTAWSNWADTYLPTSWAQQFKSKLDLPDSVAGPRVWQAHDPKRWPAGAGGGGRSRRHRHDDVVQGQQPGP